MGCVVSGTSGTNSNFNRICVFNRVLTPAGAVVGPREVLECEHASLVGGIQ